MTEISAEDKAATRTAVEPSRFFRLRPALARAPLAAAALLIALAPAASAGTLQFWEASQGSPGNTAVVEAGVGLSADIDFDADTAEGGGLLFGASEIRIHPSGAVSFVSFTCELPSCHENSDYLFTPGTAAEGGRLILSDSDIQTKNGIYDLGTFEYDADGGSGTIELVGCNYADVTGTERTCDPFTLVQVIHSLPAAGAAARAALAALLVAASLPSLRRGRFGVPCSTEEDGLVRAAH